MAEEDKSVSLKVAEAVQDDVNKGIVRIDSNYMRQIDVKPGDIVQIEGKRKTLGIVERAYPGDIGLNIIRIDGLIRRNSKTSIGELVNVTKAEIKQAKKVVIAPARKDITIRAPQHIFKHGLLGRAVMKGDIISLGGTRSRRSAMTSSPFFDDVFSMLDESMMGFGLDLKLVVAEVNPKGGVIITENTEVEINNEAIEVKDEEEIPDISYEDVGGLDEEITKVREMIELPLKHPELFERLGIEPPKGVLLHGPPGTGKTLLAKAVASETNSNFHVINGPEIMSKFYGQSEANLRKVFDDAEKNAPSIIFIDEIDAIASKREETHGDVEKRVVAQLLSIMDGLKTRGKVVVIAATNIPNSIDPALRRPGRFDREIEVGVPSTQGRLNILKIHTRNMPLDKSVDLDEIASVTHGFVGADLSSLAKEAAMVRLRKAFPHLQSVKKDEKAITISKEDIEKLQIIRDDFVDALKVVRPSALREVLLEKPNVGWKDVGGMEEVKQEIKEAIEWPLQHPDAFKRLGIRPPKGILLYGPPGTGKTLIAKAVAKESEINFISIKGPELLSKWVGESEKAVREVFKKARQASPCIIFFDEVDSLVPARTASMDPNNSQVHDSVVNQLLTEMDGLEQMNDVVVIAATNRPDRLDTALLRPGRIDRIILTPPPDEKTRIEILKVHTKNMPLCGVDINSLAVKLEGYVGADIESVCREAAILALRESIKADKIRVKHFEEALKKVRPSVNKEIQEGYERLKEEFSTATAKQMIEEKPSYFG
jgi:transitional endoplasmic reticulum ATPase